MNTPAQSALDRPPTATAAGDPADGHTGIDDETTRTLAHSALDAALARLGA